MQAVWAPFVICSPAFWVYWDLAERADGAVLAFHSLIDEYEMGLYEAEWLITAGFRYLVAGDAIRDLFRDSFEPNLLDWYRKVAEKDLLLHRKLFGLWNTRVTKILDSRANSYYPPEPVTYSESRTPTHLSLVPYGYWGKSFKQVFIARPLDIPQSGALIRRFKSEPSGKPDGSYLSPWGC